MQPGTGKCNAHGREAGLVNGLLSNQGIVHGASALLRQTHVEENGSTVPCDGTRGQNLVSLFSFQALYPHQFCLRAIVASPMATTAATASSPVITASLAFTTIKTAVIAANIPHFITAGLSSSRMRSHLGAAPVGFENGRRPPLPHGLLYGLTSEIA